MGSGGAMSDCASTASDCSDDLNFPATSIPGVTVRRELDLACLNLPAASIPGVAWLLVEARMVCVEPEALTGTIASCAREVMDLVLQCLASGI